MKTAFCGITEKGREGSRENTGNFLHGYAARHIVGDHVNVNIRDTSEESLQKVRDTCSHLAFVAATTIPVNANPDFTNGHVTLADYIEKLGLPTVVFGLGAQAPLNTAIADCKVNPNTVRLLETLSRHSESIAVRGTFTAELCNALGIQNVEVVGCQSCFISLRPDFRFPELGSDLEGSRAIFNFTRHSNEKALLASAMRAGAAHIGQSEHFEYAIKGKPVYEDIADVPEDLLALLPAAQLKLFRSGAVSFAAYHRWINDRFHQFYSMPAWFEFLDQGFDFCVGTRFHGNMASMQRGIPSLWVTHDSRTKEFCDHLGLPQVALADIPADVRIEELVKEKIDTAHFNRKYPENYRRFHEYLRRNGVQNRLASPV